MSTEPTTMAKAIKTWFRSCEYLSASNRFQIDNLGTKPTEYAIFMNPSTLATFIDITGEVRVNSIQEVTFSFCSRESYSTDVLQQLANLGFYDSIIDWVLTQNKNKSFPTIDEGVVLSVVPTTTQYLFAVGSDSGRYQIQMKLTYRRKQ